MRATSGSRARSNFKAAGASSGSRVTTHICSSMTRQCHSPRAIVRVPNAGARVTTRIGRPGLRTRGRGAIGEADEPAASWRADRPGEPPPAHSRDAVGRAPRWGLSAAWRITGRDRRRPSQSMDPRGVWRPPVPAVPRNRKHHHATVDCRRAAGRIPGADRRPRARVSYSTHQPLPKPVRRCRVIAGPWRGGRSEAVADESVSDHSTRLAYILGVPLAREMTDRLDIPADGRWPSADRPSRR